MVAFPVLAGQRITSAVLNHMYSITDQAVTTVTATSLADLSSVYVIAANDAATNVAYELQCGGNGNWGTAPPTLAFALNLGGTVVGIQPTINSTAFSSAALFRWEAVLRLTPVTTGGTATWHGSILGCVTESANNILPGTAADNTVPFAMHSLTTVTKDSTAAQNFSLQAAWGSSTGTPTIICRSTTFTRRG